jgi:hypothetical protein
MNSYFELNYIGVWVRDAANSVTITNNEMVDCEVGLYVDGGLQVFVQGNDFEGNRGPGVIVHDTRAPTFISNYFEADENCDKPKVGINMTAENTGQPNITVTADIVFTGCSGGVDGDTIGQPGYKQPGMRDGRWPVWCYGMGHPSSGVTYTGNQHNPNESTQKAAVLLVAVDGITFSANTVSQYLGTRAYSNDPLIQACGTVFAASNQSGVALAAIGTGDGFLVRRLTFAADNDNWCYRAGVITAGAGLSNGGVLQLLGDPAGAPLLATMISLDTISIEDFHARGPAWNALPPLSPRDWVADGLSVVVSSETLDALPVHSVTCGVSTGCAVTILAAELSHAPSLAGHAVSVQLQARQGSPPNKNCSLVECPFTWRIEMVGSIDGVAGSANQSFPCFHSGEWQVYTQWTTLLRSGQAKFVLRWFGPGTLDVAAVTVAPIGQRAKTDDSDVTIRGSYDCNIKSTGGGNASKWAQDGMRATVHTLLATNQTTHGYRVTCAGLVSHAGHGSGEYCKGYVDADGNVSDSLIATALAKISVKVPRLHSTLKKNAAKMNVKTDDTRPLAAHLTVMTYYTHPKLAELQIMHDWVTVVSEQGTAAGAVATMSNWSLPSLVGELPWSPTGNKTDLMSVDALLMFDNLQNRSVGECGYLQPQWREALARWAAPMLPLFANGTAQGVFTGDEVGCGTTKVNPANYSAILKEVRRLVGPNVVIYANECIHDISSSLHSKNDSKPSCCIPYPTPAKPTCRCNPHTRNPTPGYPKNGRYGGRPGNVDFPAVPAEFDLVSMDCYSKPAEENASMELAFTQAYYNENIFPSLSEHQRVLLVPGTFACKDIGMAASDTEVALKLELYLAWAESDKRIIGFNPWRE